MFAINVFQWQIWSRFSVAVYVTTQESLTGVHEERLLNVPALNAQIQDLVPQLCPRWVSTRQCSARGWPSRLLVSLALPPEPLPRLLTKHKCRSAHPLQLPFNTEAFVAFAACSVSAARVKDGETGWLCKGGWRAGAVVARKTLLLYSFTVCIVHASSLLSLMGIWGVNFRVSYSG